jgi:WD40 repeat protein
MGVTVPNNAQDEVPDALPNPLSGAPVRIFSGHIDAVMGVAFSPDGSLLASSSGDHLIKLWDMRTGENKRTLRKHNDLVSSVAFSPNGQLLASGSWDNRVIIWNVATGRVVSQLLGHAMDVNTVSFSPDGKLLASGDLNGTVKLWDVARGTIVRTFLGHAAGVTSAVFSPDGTLVTGGLDGDIHFWNVSTGENMQTYNAPLSHVKTIALSPDGLLLAAGGRINFTAAGWEGGIQMIWNLANEDEPPIIDYEGQSVESVALSPDGAQFANVQAGGWVQLRDISNFSNWEWIWGRGEQGGNAVTFAPDNSLLAIGSDDGLVTVRNTAVMPQVENLFGHEGGARATAFSPDGKWLASGSTDDTIKLWNLTDRTEWQTLSVDNGTVLSLAFNPSGRLLASSHSGAILIWNVTNGTLFQRLSGEVWDGAASMAFSPDGTKVATGGWDWNVRIWDVATGIQERTLLTSATVFSAAYLPLDDRVIVSGSRDGSVRLWEVANSYNYQTEEEHAGEVREIACSQDGRFLASAGEDGTIKLWNVTYEQGSLPNLTLWRTLIGHSDYVRTVTFSPEGTLLFSGSWDGTIRIWNVTTGKELQALTAHLDYVTSLAVAPDGTTLASTGNDRLVRLWNLDPLPLDSDLDGMADYWERENGLDPSNFWDKFEDSDHDGLMSSMEFVLGTTPVRADSDDDGMPDGWEFRMGLALLKDDAAADHDNDGMPNGWEYRHDLDATDPTDASQDSDDDGVSNLNEYKGSSDPQNFLSVPLLSFSLPHLGVSLFLLGSTLVGVSFWYYREKSRKDLITRLGAPDYATALKIQSGGFKDHTSLLQAQAEANALGKKALDSYHNRDYAVAFRQLEFSLALYERLENQLRVAETIYHLIRLQKEMEMLTQDSSVLQRFPLPPYDDATIEALDHMLQALVAEADKNWGFAENAWQMALETEGLDIAYQTRCQGALVEAEVRKWLSNPSAPVQETLRARLDKWQKTCEMGQQFESQCQVYLLRAKVALASFQFEEMENWLEQCLMTANAADLRHYQDLARQEIAKSAEHREKLGALIDKERLLVPEEKEKILHEYIRKAFEFVSGAAD